MRKILFADDDEALRRLVASMLDSAGYQACIVHNGNEALDEVRRTPPDLVLLDYRMGRPDGFEVCRTIKADPRLNHLPVLILTGEGELHDRLNGFDAGADDYLAKPFDPRELLARIAALLRLARRGRERNPTSGLPGGEAIYEEVQRWRERGEPFAVAYLDLDHFKPFGDRFGFATADAVIHDVGEVLNEVVEGKDGFAGHVGGDDFLIIAPRAGARGAVVRAQRLFTERLQDRLPPEVVREGSFRAASRDGDIQSFPLTRLSAAIVHLRPDQKISLAELGEQVARMKSKAKSGEKGIAEVELSLS